MKKIRLGIIGCGNMTGQHLDSFEKLSDVMTVSAVCDVLEERAERAREILSAQTAFTDYRQMLDSVDAVLVALPHKLHYPVGKFFVENGKHVLMEKPLCINEKECLDLTALADKHNVKLMTAYPVRFWQEIHKMKELMDSGFIGDVFQMAIYTDLYNAGADTRGSWMTCSGLGGGQFFSHGCHYVDILLWFLGSPVSGTHMGTKYGTPWMDREGTSHAVIKFESGALGYHTGTWGAKGSSHRYQIDAYGTEGTLSYAYDGPYGGKITFFHNHGALKKEDRKIETVWEKPKTSSGKSTDGEIEHFIDCILHDKMPITNGKTSLVGLRCIWKMYEAEARGEVADLRGLGLDDPFIPTPICTFDCDSPEATKDYK